MAQVTETDLQDLKDLIKGLDKKIDLGFLEVKGELNGINTRLTLLETAVTKLDGRLWLFMGLVLAPTLIALMGIVVRYIFLDMPSN